MEKGNKISQNDNEHEHSWEKTRPRWLKEREDQWEKNDKKINKQPHFVCCVCVRVFKTRKILFPILQYLFECSSLIFRKYSISFFLFLSLCLSLLIFYSRIMDTEKWMQCNAMQNAANQSQTQPNVTKRKILLLAAYSRDRSAGYE